MFKEAINAVLVGDVICEVTNPRIFKYLSGETGFQEVNAHLLPMGRKLSNYPNGAVFYVAHSSQADVRKGHITEMYRHVASEFRPVLDFTKLLLQADGEEGVLSTGDLLEVNALTARVGSSETARRELAGLTAKFRVKSDASDHSRMLGIMKKLESWGYVRTQNAEREIFQVTGKIELFKAVLDLLRENWPGAKDEMDMDEEQGVFF